MKLWPFKVVNDPKSYRPQVVVTYQKNEKIFAEDISSMVLQKF